MTILIVETKDVHLNFNGCEGFERHFYDYNQHRHIVMFETENQAEKVRSEVILLPRDGRVFKTSELNIRIYTTGDLDTTGLEGLVGAMFLPEGPYWNITFKTKDSANKGLEVLREDRESFLYNAFVERI